jgi:hypothetical protein
LEKWKCCAGKQQHKRSGSCSTWQQSPAVEALPQQQQQQQLSLALHKKTSQLYQSIFLALIWVHSV